MGTKFVTGVGVFSAEPLISLQSFKVLGCKLTEIALFIYLI